MTPGQNPTLQRRSACVTAWRRASFDFTIRLACANSFLGRLILRHNQSESVIRFRNLLHILVSPLRPVRLLAELCILTSAVQCRNPPCDVLASDSPVPCDVYKSLREFANLYSQNRYRS